MCDFHRFLWRARGEEGFSKVSARRREIGAVVKCLAKRSFVPAGDFHSVEVEDGREGIQLVESWNDVSILNVCQPADVQDELLPSSFDGYFVTCFFYITIGQSQR